MAFCHIPLQPADDPRAELWPGVWEFAKFGVMFTDGGPILLS
jgi:hypothetical protein